MFGLDQETDACANYTTENACCRFMLEGFGVIFCKYVTNTRYYKIKSFVFCQLSC